VFPSPEYGKKLSRVAALFLADFFLFYAVCEEEGKRKEAKKGAHPAVLRDGVREWSY
jgi:hypothetical protein